MQKLLFTIVTLMMVVGVSYANDESEKSSQELQRVIEKMRAADDVDQILMCQRTGTSRCSIYCANAYKSPSPNSNPQVVGLFYDTPKSTTLMVILNRSGPAEWESVLVGGNDSCVFSGMSPPLN